MESGGERGLGKTGDTQFNKFRTAITLNVGTRAQTTSKSNLTIQERTNIGTYIHSYVNLPPSGYIQHFPLG